ncbi:MAG: hypothetical protein OXU63_03880 [Acidobacteriota bacterium]|nr:hypothetical protein [Acidobacteriota bacterium]
MTPTTREPFASIRNAPGRFVIGSILIVLSVVGITVLVYERNFELWLGLQAGFQGAAYMWLLKTCREKRA